MNALEHYIKEVYSVEDITNKLEERLEFPLENPVVLVNMRIDCYGVEEDVSLSFSLPEWEEIKQRGYYMA